MIDGKKDRETKRSYVNNREFFPKIVPRFINVRFLSHQPARINLLNQLI